MKTLKTITCLAAGTLLLAFTNSAFAGTMTPSGSPSFSPAGVVSANTIALQQTAPGVLKILGNATITPGAGASTVTLTLLGTFTANTGDLASYAYNFNIALTSATPASFTLSLSAGGLSTSTSPQTVPANSNQAYTGRNQTVAAPFGTSGSFTGQLQINFAAGTTASDQLVLSIPANSIDFAVQPEPSTYALLAVAALGFLLWKRRQPAGVGA